MTDIKELDRQLLKEVSQYQKKYLENHKNCKEGINFPDGTHSCKKIERATSRQFKEKYKQNFLMKLEISGLK